MVAIPPWVNQVIVVCILYDFGTKIWNKSVRDKLLPRIEQYLHAKGFWIPWRKDGKPGVVAVKRGVNPFLARRKSRSDSVEVKEGVKPAISVVKKPVVPVSRHEVCFYEK